MVQRLLVKVIYFLMKYVKTEIATLNDFADECEKLANGRFYAVSVELRDHNQGDGRYATFTSYIDCEQHISGSTPQESLAKRKVNLKNENQINTVIC